MIDSRPGVIELRQEVGHWEGDTVMGACGERTCLLTLVERATGLALVIRLPHRPVRAVNRAVIGAIRNSGVPFKTITWDNGTEGLSGKHQADCDQAVAELNTRPRKRYGFRTLADRMRKL